MMGKVIMSCIVPPLVKPSIGILLSDISEGSVVKLTENGIPVEFYVVKHNYESGLNGAGRTLLLRKESSGNGIWNTGYSNVYAGSTIDTYLNSTYKSLLSAEAQAAIGTTKFYYTTGGGITTKTTLQRSVFALSLFEYGSKVSSANDEGTTQGIAEAYRTDFNQWTRTPDKRGNTLAYIVQTAGNFNNVSVTNGNYYYRPAFTLPSTAVFDEETLILKGVA